MPKPKPPPPGADASPGAKPEPALDGGKGNDALGLVDKAKADGKLDGLQQVLDDHGWPTPAEDFLMLAQNDDRTKGKSPDELADMLQGDGSLYDDVEATKPGGQLEKKHPDTETPAEDAVEAPGDEAVEEEIAGQMTNPMSERDKKRAPGVLKGMGKSAKDLGNFDTKAGMMERIAKR
jgi:hypothetical protein